MIQWDIIGIGIIDLNKTYEDIVFFYIKNDVLKCVHAFFRAYIDKVRRLSTKHIFKLLRLIILSRL